MVKKYQKTHLSRILAKCYVNSSRLSKIVNVLVEICDPPICQKNQPWYIDSVISLEPFGNYFELRRFGIQTF